MNDFFCNIGKNLSDKLPQTENPLLESRFSVNEHNLRFEFQAVNIAQVEKVFGKFKKSLGFGTDGIANHFLKIALPVIGESLCNIFNLSIATGVFPDCWKIARVAKVVNLMIDQIIGRSQCFLSCLVSRVFEKLVFNQLYEYLDKDKLIYYKQSGLRSLHSAVTCLLKSTNDWYVNMDKGRFTATVFIDLKKAFDSVDHDILLQKFEKYGVIGLEHTWFSSYLKNRRQLCRVNGVASNMEEIKCGVPQGSCLGPLLFLIYINDLPFALKNSEVTMHADDTSMSYSSKNIYELNETLNSDLDSLKQWLEGN